ncbi:hypothetical protein CP97_14871 (plasmid) [Aurantiacibacter atlanticus]|uniref:Uncharacterized protein n=1 Tax=Aurantiacibacter atlanticus TaxID=1648404 RepID=A0A161J4H7_9SPHN|nr:hypothetical protein CP97_14871 [Aurantiacibacter atlanticus]
MSALRPKFGHFTGRMLIPEAGIPGRHLHTMNESELPKL